MKGHNMKKLKGYEIRQLWLDFFKSKGHAVIPSAPLVPHDDPTLLWINAGVAPLKKYFDGNAIEVKGDIEQIELDWMGRPMPSPEEWVNLPDDKFFSPKMRLAFIQWCYDNSICFDKDVSNQSIYDTSKEVFIYRYITEGSFDAYSWQLLESKQRFISQILSGDCTQRECADVDETVLNYAEVKALAVGNPKIKRRVEVANELSKYRILERDVIARKSKLREELDGIPANIEKQKKTCPDWQVLKLWLGQLDSNQH